MEMEMINDRQYLKMFGNHLKKLRNSKFTKLKHMAESCKMDCGRLSRIEAGKANVTMATLLSLAACLQVPITKLLEFHR